MRARMPMGGVAIDAQQTASAPSRVSATPEIGLLVFRTRTRATLHGSSINITSRSCRAMAVGMRLHATHRLGKVRRFCKGAQSAGDAVGTSVLDTPPGVAASTSGMFVIELTPRTASPLARRLMEHPLTRRLARSLLRR